MNNTRNNTTTEINIIEINKQLSLLEDAFYDGIDWQLQNHPDISNFSYQMNFILSNIRKIITQKDNKIKLAETNETNEPISNIVENIDYKQLEKIGIL